MVFFELDDIDISFLRQQWENLSSFYTSDATIRDHVFQIIKDKYSEEGRFYHNLSHVKTLLGLYESLRAQIQNHNATQFSIWLHDVTYDSKRDDNEEESAKLASEILGKLGVDHKTTEFVNKLILATKVHDAGNLPFDAQLLLDMDLGILGASEEVYDEYSRAIRKEYSWVSEPMYREGRTQILKRFMDRGTVYFTDEMQARYEKQARTNIKREIRSLNSRK